MNVRQWNMRLLTPWDENRVVWLAGSHSWSVGCEGASYGTDGGVCTEAAHLSCRSCQLTFQKPILEAREGGKGCPVVERCAFPSWARTLCLKGGWRVLESEKDGRILKAWDGQLRCFCVRVTWKEETVSPKGVLGRKGMANSTILTVDDEQLFEIGKTAEVVLAISYIIKLQK